MKHIEEIFVKLFILKIEFLPPAISFAHRLTRKLTEVRKNGTLNYFRLDGKSQVTVEFDNNGNVARVRYLKRFKKK